MFIYYFFRGRLVDCSNSDLESFDIPSYTSLEKRNYILDVSDTRLKSITPEQARTYKYVDLRNTPACLKLKQPISNVGCSIPTRVPSNNFTIRFSPTLSATIDPSTKETEIIF